MRGNCWDELLANQPFSQTTFAHSGVADEKDFGVCVLDLVTRDRQSPFDGSRCEYLGDKLREIPYQDVAIDVGREGVKLIRTPRHTKNCALVTSEDAQTTPRIYV